jgi:hypothetical protein
MAYRAALSNFTKGEISPEAEARFELPVYQAAVRTARNVKIQRTGGLKKRMGTRFVAEALSASARLIPFQFSDDQAYVLEFGQALMRPLALGGRVLETGLAVTAITKSAQAQITAAYHGYAVGDPVYLNSIQGMVEINDRFLTVQSVIDDNNFTVDFDSTNAGTFTGDSGGISRTAPPDPPPTAPTVPPVETNPAPPVVGGNSSGSYAGGGTSPSDPTDGIWSGVGTSLA